MLTLVNIFNVFKYGLTGVFLFIDGIVYWAISKLFALYEALAKVEFITQGDYQEIANKFYVIIGVVMLFYLTYSLLKTLINPDDFNKNISKIATNLVISLILLGVVPLIFSYAFQIQDAIISENIIGNLVLGGDINENSENKNSISHDGNSATISILNTFLNPGKEDFDGEETTWNEFLTNANAGDSKAFLNITDFAEPVHDGDVEYMPIVSTLCGAFLVYVLISFCIDLGIRVAKLAFYEIIAPIPILMRVIPEKKSVFDNWVKGTLATFMEVFIRLFIMFIIVLLVGLIFDDAHLNLFDNNVGFIGNVIVVLGLFAFAKQAPKLISDVIGVDSGNIKLGIGGKLAAGGAFGMAAVLGGGITTGVRNLTNGVIKQNGFRRTLGSTLAGVVSGGFRSGKAGFSAKTYKDVKNAASQGAVAAVNKRDEREEKVTGYRAKYGDNMVGVAHGIADEAISNIKAWATGSGTGILNKVKWEEKFKDLFGDYQAIYENPKYNAMDAELQKIKALQNTGATTYEGQPIVDAIENLEGKMLEARMDSIRKNKQSAAYAMYNIAQMAKSNPTLAGSIGLNVSMADDLVLKGGQILDKSTGNPIDENKLYSMIEGSALTNVASYNATLNSYVDASGSVIDLKAAAKTNDVLKDGMKHQKKIATDAAKADKISIAYKEAIKREEANKK